MAIYHAMLEKKELAMAKKDKDKKDSELFDELEKCIEEMESGDLELEDSLEKYAEGVELVSKLQAKLQASEVIIKELSGKIERDETFDDTQVSHA